MTTTESFGRGRIAETILSSVSVPFTLNISKVPTNENQFITIDPDTNNEEIFYYTTKTGTIGEAGTLNITGRGYNVQNDTQAAGNQKEHEENGEFKLALNHIIINNKADTKTTNTFTQTQTFEGDALFTTTDNLGLKVNQLTTVERDLITPSNGYIIYNSTDGVNQQYISGAWNDVGNTGTPDATETVAGKVEKATQAEFDAMTEFGSTGATLFVNPSQLVDATTTIKGKDRLATNAEVKTGTLTTTIVVPDTFYKNTVNIGVVASDVLKCSADTERVSNQTGNYHKVKEIAIGDNYRKGGTIRVKVDTKGTEVSGTWYGNVAIYKNGALLQSYGNVLTENYTTQTYDTTVNEGDLIQIYLKSQNVSAAERVSYAENFRVHYDEVLYPKECSVTLD